MKIRNGFVSNSSSSSFILVYDKTKVVDNATSIVEYLKENPNTEPVFYGNEMGEGDDVYMLPSNYESLIRKFPQEFINTCKGNHPQLYCNATLLRDEEDTYWGNAESIIDMSDMEDPYISREEMNEYFKDRDHIKPELQEKFDKCNAYARVKEERLKEYADKKNAENVEKATDNLVEKGSERENIAHKEIYIDTFTTEEYDSDFISTYFTEDESDSYDYLISNRMEMAQPYVVFYKDMISDKQEILNHIEKYKGERCYIFWSNPMINFIRTQNSYDDGVDIDFYEVGEKEREILKEELLKSNRLVYLVTDAIIALNGDGSLDEGCKYLVGYGRPAVIRAGNNLADFEENFN